MKRWCYVGLLVATLAWAGCGTLFDDDDPIESAECWVEIYEDANFIRDNPWTRIQGPTELESLGELAGYDWNDKISSIRVGRDARLVIYEHADFKGELREYDYDRIVDNLEDDRMNDRVSSMKVSCR